MMLALARDIFAAMMFHLTLFYVYASFIYAVQVRGLFALSQIFRAMRVGLKHVLLSLRVRAWGPGGVGGGGWIDVCIFVN